MRGKVTDIIFKLEKVKRTIVFLILFLPYSKTAFAETDRDSLENLIRNSVSDSLKLTLLDRFSWELRRIDTTTALRFANQGLELSIKLNSKNKIINFYKDLASIYKQSSDYGKALEYLAMVRQKSEEINDSSGILFAINSFGSLYELQGNYNIALDYYFKALEFSEKSNIPANKAKALINIGNLYNLQGEYDKALKFCQIGLKINNTLLDIESISNAYMTIGNIYLNKKNYDSALSCYFKSLKLREEVSDKGGVANIYHGIAFAFQQLKQFESARNFAEKSLQLKIEINDRSGIAAGYNLLGSCYLSQQDYKPALELFQKAYQISTNLNALDILKETCGYLSRTYAGVKDYHLAYLYQVKFKELSDTIKNENQIRKVAQLGIQYEFDKKQQQQIFDQHRKDNANKAELDRQRQFIFSLIAVVFLISLLSIILFRNSKNKKNINQLLMYKNEEIERTNLELYEINLMITDQKEESEQLNNELNKINDELVATNLKLLESEKNLKDTVDTKDKFFSIIAHDLKNPLSYVLSMSEFIDREYSSISQEEILNFNKKINEAASQIFKLLENLLDWSRSQTGNISFTPESCDIKPIIDETINHLINSAKNKNIEIVNNVPDSTMVFVDRNMIDTVVRNLISNSIKFSGTPVFPNGKVVIEAKRIEDNYQISVSDNGVGIKPDYLDKLFNIDFHPSTKGTSNETGTGLGLILCHEFVEKNGGKIRAENTLDHGTVFYFTLPVTEQKGY